jgi:hypothetical protein
MKCPGNWGIWGEILWSGLGLGPSFLPFSEKRVSDSFAGAWTDNKLQRV